MGTIDRRRHLNCVQLARWSDKQISHVRPVENPNYHDYNSEKFSRLLTANREEKRSDLKLHLYLGFLIWDLCPGRMASGFEAENESQKSLLHKQSKIVKNGFLLLTGFYYCLATLARCLATMIK